MRPYGVLVCGSNYARSYISAAQAEPETFCLKGVLARGSTRSRMLAERLQLPLFVSLDQIPGDIDLACVAVGSSAPQVMLGLLERGIHVLAEHPQHPRAVAAALHKADNRGLSFQINAHFSALRAPASFIEFCRRLTRDSKPHLVRVLASDRTLYGILDILCQSLQPVESVRFGPARMKRDFVELESCFGGTEASFQLQSATAGNRELPDGSPHYLVDIRITAVFPSGTLSLLSLAGPVFWNSNLMRTVTPAQNLCLMVREASATAEALTCERIRANEIALRDLVEQVETGESPEFQSPSHLTLLAKSWQDASVAIADRTR